MEPRMKYRVFTDVNEKGSRFFITVAFREIDGSDDMGCGFRLREEDGTLFGMVEMTGPHRTESKAFSMRWVLENRYFPESLEDRFDEVIVM